MYVIRKGVLCLTILLYVVLFIYNRSFVVFDLSIVYYITLCGKVRSTPFIQ